MSESRWRVLLHNGFASGQGGTLPRCVCLCNPIGRELEVRKAWCACERVVRSECVGCRRRGCACVEEVGQELCGCALAPAGNVLKNCFCSFFDKHKQELLLGRVWRCLRGSRCGYSLPGNTRRWCLFFC